MSKLRAFVRLGTDRKPFAAYVETTPGKWAGHYPNTVGVNNCLTDEVLQRGPSEVQPRNRSHVQRMVKGWAKKTAAACGFPQEVS